MRLHVDGSPDPYSATDPNVALFRTSCSGLTSTGAGWKDCELEFGEI